MDLLGVLSLKVSFWAYIGIQETSFLPAGAKEVSSLPDTLCRGIIDSTNRNLTEGKKVNDYSEDFWNELDELVNTSEIIIDRPKGSAHPRFPDFIYRVDYGYLRDTASMDGAGIDVWVGSGKKTLDAIMCIVDLMKRDSEIKILIGCTEEEKMEVYKTHNETQYMKGILIRR